MRPTCQKSTLLVQLCPLLISSPLRTNLILDRHAKLPRHQNKKSIKSCGYVSKQGPEPGPTIRKQFPIVGHPTEVAPFAKNILSFVDAITSTKLVFRPTQPTLIFLFLCLYLSIVFHGKYQIYKYLKYFIGFNTSGTQYSGHDKHYNKK